MSLSRAGLTRGSSHGSVDEVGLRFVALHPGTELADEVRACLLARQP
jgi:hypothetical protein